MSIYDIYHNITQVREISESIYKRAFIEAKVLVDRNGISTTTFFVSESTKSDAGFGDRLWGADIVASNIVKDNEVIAYCCLPIGLDKSIGKIIVKGWVKESVTNSA